eukprot:772290_1
MGNANSKSQTRSPIARESNNQTISLSIFSKDENECVASDYAKCDAMERLISSFKYRSMLKTKKQADYAEIFVQFMNDVYNGKHKGLIDDYIHFKDHHEHELERITRELIQSNAVADCSILQCEFTKRHMDEPNTDTNASDPKLAFYDDTFDALHFHL